MDSMSVNGCMRFLQWVETYKPDLEATINIQVLRYREEIQPFVSLDCHSFSTQNHRQRDEGRSTETLIRPLVDPKYITLLAERACVVKMLESLLEDTEDLLDSKAHLILPAKKELEAVYKCMRFFRFFLDVEKFLNFFDFSESEKQKALLTHVEDFAFKIARQLCFVNCKMNDHMGRTMKLELGVQLQSIYDLHPEIRDIYIKALKDASKSPQPDTPTENLSALYFLRSLLDNIPKFPETKLGFITSIKDQILALHQELELVKFYIINPLWSEAKRIFDDQELRGLCKLANSLISETGYLFLSLYDADENEDMARELKVAVPSLLAKVGNIKAYARKACQRLVPKSIRSNFPRTNFQGFISSLLQYLENLVEYSEADKVVALKSDIEAVQKELQCVRDDFSKIAKIPREHVELNHQWNRFIDLTYLTEHLIDAVVAGGCYFLTFKFGLFDVIEEIKTVKRELKTVQTKTSNDDHSVQGVGNFSSDYAADDTRNLSNDVADSLPNDLSSSTSAYPADGTINLIPELVVFNNEADRIQDQLTGHDEGLLIVSIVGLPGIGKTTLADSLYDHSLVASSFRVRAKICVSKEYQKRKLLLGLLQGAIGETEIFVEMGDEELEEALYQSLKGRRYLILMDDVWDIKPWLDIMALLPDDRNGSRIMFTSRFHNIASQAKQNSISYELHLLSPEKSWEMLRIKLFQKEESCPPKLVEIGKEIAKSCKGLPLTIDLIAGVLRTKERKESCWRQVAKNIMKEISGDPKQRCQKVLEQSYSDLPDYLKPCFLYFGAFPQDTEIPAKRLIWLWIAEGFIQQQMVHEGIENAAEAYLNDLVARSLVSISKIKSLDGVKANRIHDLLHDFACRKAEEEFFLLQIKSQPNISSSSSYGYTNEGYRMFCNSKNQGQVDIPRDLSARVRSLLVYHNHLPFYDRASLTFNVGRFRLLRVLDLQNVEESIDAEAIRLMLHLKFIALSPSKDWILSALQRFKNLETIILVGSGRKRIFYINNIWNLLRLRHFLVGYCVLKLPTGDDLMKSFQFTNLLTLSTLCLRCNEETERMMRSLPNLQKLSCAVYDSWDSTKNCNLFPKLDFLEQLYSLKMVYVGNVFHSACEFSFPPCLKKLSLSEFRLPWSEISTIAKLQNLEVLKLRIRAFEGEIWDMEDVKFPKLKVLSLCKLEIREWKAEDVEDSLELLQRLEVLDCNNLVELPFGLANITTLKVIRVWRCSSSLESSAEKIVEQQKENIENEELKINRDPQAKTGWRDRMEILSLHL